MALEFETGGEVSGQGGYIDQPGTYHLLVVDATETPTKKDGSLLPGAMFGVTVEVLAGTVAGQKSKIKNLTFYHPKPDQSDKGRAFILRKRDRFLMAVGLLTPQQIEAKEKVRLDIGEAVGRHLIAKFEKEADDSKYVDVAFDEMYHVDDPAVEAIPKHVVALKAIDPKLRWTGAQASAAAKGRGGAAAAAGSTAAKKAPATPAPLAASAPTEAASVYEQGGL